MSEEAPELTLEDVMSGRAVSADMMRDLRAIALLDVRSVDAVTAYLSHLKGLQAKETLKQGIAACLPTSVSNAAESIVRTLLNLKEDDVARILRTLDRWRHSSEDRKNAFTTEMFGSLERNLQKLVGKYPSVELFRKADRLLREVGNEFRDVAFFCDMRPVFDESRTKVEGFVTLANIRLMYVSQDNEQHVCEIALTEEELRKLVEQCNKALGKLGVLAATSEQVRGKLGQEGSQT